MAGPGPSDDRKEQEEGFLRRWSRRKGAKATRQSETKARFGPDKDVHSRQAVRDDVASLPREDYGHGVLVADQAAESGDSPQENTDQATIDEVELPDIESLNADSDFRPFLRKGVSEQLQRRALRKLWLSDPVLANVDGLVDYGEDFTDAATVVENLKSVYTVGKGIVAKPAQEEDVDTGEDDAPDADDMEAEEMSEEGSEPADLLQDEDIAATGLRKSRSDSGARDSG